MDHLEQKLAALEKHVAECFNAGYERLMGLSFGVSEANDPNDKNSAQDGAITAGGEHAAYRAVRAADRLGRPWGIRNERLCRQTMREILEKNFGAKVEELYIRGEQFDCLIFDGQHILVEIAASVGRDIHKRLERKRQLYIDETGIVPARFILAVGSIHSQRAEALRAAGFDVIEPEEEV